MNKLVNLLTVVSIFSSTVLVSSVTNNVVSHHHVLDDKNRFPFFYKAEGIERTENIQDMTIATNNKVYAWSGNNLFASDNGQNFKNIFTNKITSVGIKNNDIYVGTSNNLFKSDDGYIFTEVADVFKGKTINKIVVAQNGMMLVATNQGLYQSTNGLDYNKISNFIVTNLAVSETGIIYIVHDNCLEKSIDGNEWITIFKEDKNKLGAFALGPNNEIAIIVKAPNNNYLSLINKDGSINEIDLNLGTINKVQITLSGTIILATKKGMYQSFDHKTFSLYLPFFNKLINTFALDFNQKAYIVTPTQGIYVINLLKNLLNIKNPDYCSAQYDATLVYNTPQYVDLKLMYLTKAVLNGETLVIPTNKLQLRQGKYHLTLTVNEDYKNFISIFGGDVKTGTITYNFEIKDNINNNIVSYSPSADSTILEQGLVSDAGNTKNCEIVQTRDKSYLGEHPAQLTVAINDQKGTLINYRNSYYISGEVNESNNDFNVKGKKQLVKNHFTIKLDGIYQLHLVDLVGNVHNSYVELGSKNNNKLHGKIIDTEVSTLADQLNVTISVFNPSEKRTILQWLQNYQILADEQFNKILKHCGKGFDIKINDLPNGYKSFLNPITYFNRQTYYDFNTNKLRTAIYNFSNNMLKNKLNKMKSDLLNVNSSNVINKNTLDKFTIWFNNYQNYLDTNKDVLFNKISRIATRGFGDEKQVELVKKAFFNITTFNEDYLKKIIWNDNIVNDSFDYSKLIKFNLLLQNAIKKVDDICPHLNQIYQTYLLSAENKVDMHGYKLSQLLENRQLPQTKEEIDNYAENESFTQWLQKIATLKFHKWQLTIGLSIGIPLLVIISLPSLYFYWAYNEKYNPKPYKIYKRLQKIDQQRFKQRKTSKKLTS